MELKSTFNWSELGGLAEKRKAERMAELQAWWNENAPEDEKFKPDKATALLLHHVKRYEVALLRIVEKVQEQQTLMKHREQTGQEVPESAEQRYFAYLKVAHIAAEALGQRVPVSSLTNMEPDSR